MLACYLLLLSLFGPCATLEIACSERRCGCEVILNVDRGQTGRPLLPLFHSVVDFVVGASQDTSSSMALWIISTDPRVIPG